MAKAPQETKTYYICPFGAAHRRGRSWRGMCRKRHRERCPDCKHEPFGVSYKTADRDARIEAAEREADEQGMDECERSKAVKRARHTFFYELATKADAEWRAGRGRAMALKRAVEGGRLVRIVVPSQAQPGDFFAHRGVKGLLIKRTDDGRYVESKEEDMWEQQPDVLSDAATPACPIGPVPDPRPACMIITVWTREQRPSEAAAEAAKAAEADEAAAVADEAALEAEAPDDDADSESDEEEGEAEEGEAAPTAPAIAASAPAEPTDEPAAPIAAVAPTAAPPVSVAADANARIEAAVAAAVAEATQGGMSASAAQRSVRCSRALTSEPHTPSP